MRILIAEDDRDQNNILKSVFLGKPLDFKSRLFRHDMMTIVE